jgi:hypothetical protein
MAIGRYETPEKTQHMVRHSNNDPRDRQSLACSAEMAGHEA